jgi:hypothetical protein
VDAAAKPAAAATVRFERARGTRELDENVLELETSLGCGAMLHRTNGSSRGRCQIRPLRLAAAICRRVFDRGRLRDDCTAWADTYISASVAFSPPPDNAT